MKKKICILLTIVLIVSLCGCTAQSNPTVATAPPATAAPATAAPTAQAPAQPLSMYPISDGSVTLTYWRPLSSSLAQYMTSLSENMAYKELMKMTGIKLEFIHPSAGQEKADFNLLVASADLPDIMQIASYYNGGVTQAYEDGLILDITPYAETLCPDWYALLKSDKEFYRQVMTEDDKLLYFCRAWYEGNSTYNRVAVNKNWWSEYSNEKWPVTMEDYDGYFAHVKEKYPDVYALGLRPDNLLWYGAYNILNGWMVVDGKIENGNAVPAYGDFLKQLNDWYAKGYISPEFGSGEFNKQFGAKQLGAVTGSIDGISSAALAGGVDIISCPLPRVNASDILHCQERTEFMGGIETCVSSTTKHAEEAIKFLNYGYTQEGAMIYNYGIEDLTYTMVNGVPTYTDYVLKSTEVSLGAALQYFRIHEGPKLCPDGLKCNPSILGDPSGLEFRLLHSDDPNVDSKYRIPPIQLTADENTRRSELLTAINTYIEEMRLKFIVGVEPLSKFDAYLTQLDSLGYQEAQRITQNAYDRYMSR